MRTFVKFCAALVVFGITWLLFQLPQEVVKHIFYQWIAEGIASETGLKMPKIQFVIGLISYLIPFLATVATFILYYRFVKYIEPPPSIAVKSDRIDVSTPLLVLFLAAFVGITIYSGYRNGFSSSAFLPAQYSEIRYLSNQDLRERGLSVAIRLGDLYNEATKLSIAAVAMAKRTIAP
jgi:hypothetical protein